MAEYRTHTPPISFFFFFQGEAMVAYDDPPAAKAAIEWFNGMHVVWGL